MADVARRVGLREQIHLVAGLRWRILRNSLRKKNNALDLIGMIAAGIFAGTLVFGLSFAFYLGARSAFSGGHLGRLALLFWGVFLFWQVFPIFVAGFGASFEFRTILRFPLSLTAFYLIGLAYGLADFAAIAAICWLVAMVAGVAAGNPAVLPAMLWIVAVFILMSVTFERLIGSWLERLLARRRTREVIFGLVILLSVSVQFLRPLLERSSHGAPASLLRWTSYFSFFPPSLAGRAVASAATNHWSSFLLGLAGLFLYVAAFSGLLWHRFSVQYRGEELSEAAAPVRRAVRQNSRETAAEDSLRLLSPQIAAVVRKDFRYLLRNGFVLVSLLMAPLLVLLFTSQFAGKHPSVASHAITPDMFFPGMAGYLILLLMTPAYNCFAYEGHGIQTYFTAPVIFRNIFLGKNLVHASVVVFECALSLAVLAARIGLPSPPVLVATCAAVVLAVAGQFSIANWASLSFPRKLEFGSMRGQRNSGISIWLAFGVQLLLAGISSLILFSGRWTGNAWLPAEAFTGLAIAAIAGYIASLDALTMVAEKKKEVLIEALSR